MSLEILFRTGYAIVIISVLLMLWVTYISGAACPFDAQCSCTLSSPTNFGQVECLDTHVILPPLNTSRVFTLSLINNRLDYLSPRVLQGTGLSKLILAKNPIYALHEESLSGVERSLWELHIVDCKLSSIPGNAVRHLYRLKILNLAGVNGKSLDSFEKPDAVDFKIISVTLPKLDLNEISTDQKYLYDICVGRIASGSVTTSLVRHGPGKMTHSRHWLTRAKRILRLYVATSKKSENLLILGKYVVKVYAVSWFEIKCNPSSSGGNEISSINTEQLRGVSASLQTLILSNNKLTVLSTGIFSSLQSLEVLDLNGNSISSLDPGVFTPAPPKLRDLNLEDNLFDNIPYKQIANIRTLRILNLNYNHISKVDQGVTGIKLNVDLLMLEHNDITELGTYAMANFEVANTTSFKANPLKIIEANAFQGCRMLELILSECKLQEVNPESFNGLERSLQKLDISDNPLSNISYFAFNSYLSLQVIHLDDTHLQNMDWLLAPGDSEQGMHLSELKINGKSKEKIHFNNLPRFRHLHTLSISNALLGGISANDLKPFSIELETFIAHESGIKSLLANTFVETRGIKTIDLTDNQIEKIDSKCFIELGHSLETLILMHSFTSAVSVLPLGLFKPLNALKIFKINHNSLTRVPQDISSLSNMQLFHAHDNKIDSLSRNLFKGNVHKNLEDINLSFNKISKIQTNSFYDLEKLLKINLADNAILNIEQGSFGNLYELTTLSLRGNKVTILQSETFQNLPCLEYLDLAFNSLSFFNFASLDQVGTLSSLTVNISYNLIRSLTPNISYVARDSIYTSVKVLDFSHNNISFIDKNYLVPVQHTLTHLYLSYNSLENASRDVLPEMPLLQLLDLSHNMLSEIEFDALRSVRNLQVIILSHNKLKDLPDDLFLSLNSLRSIDLSHNLLYTVMDAMMSPVNLVSVDISYNDLTRVPVSSFSPMAAASLLELHVGHNRITGLPVAETFARFENLRVIDLTSNRLTEIGNSLSLLPCLSKLSISHNFIHIGGKDFLGLEDTLEHLDLTNVSISYVPSLPLSSLKMLRIAHNLISFLPPDLSTNLSSLKYLDVSYNNLQTVPLFPQLKTLYLAGNEISVISNTSFNEFPYVYDLDIRHLPLNDFDEEGLTSLLGLQSLHISSYKDIKNFNIPDWTQDNKGLRYLHVELKDSASLDQVLKGNFPKKVRHIAFTGKEIKSLPDSLLKGIHYPSVQLTLRNTSVETLQPTLFSSLPYIRNISIDAHNNSLKTLANPSNTGAVNRPGKTFLVDLYMEGNQWTCDCQLGWIETWQRKRRQIYSVDYTVEDSRQAKCKNKQNKPLLDILKSDIECGWSTGTVFQPTMFVIILTFFTCF